MLLTREICLVTGASRGIGRASALALAREGAKVIVNYHSLAEKAEEVCHEIIKAGGQASICGFDVADAQATSTAIEAVLKENKKISVLVNNAGIAKDGLLMRYSVADWDMVINTNLRGAFVTSQAVVRSMMREKRGSIVNMSSVVGLIGNAGQAAYCAAKAGLIGLTKSMARELASRNIRVNSIAPGFIDTDMTSALTPDQIQSMIQQIPLARTGTAEEIAEAVVFLASERSRYMTGQVISVDGGMNM